MVKIPTLNTAQIGFARSFGANKGNSGVLGQKEFDNYLSSSSEDSKAKARVKDIVFDPR